MVFDFVTDPHGEGGGNRGKNHIRPVHQVPGIVHQGNMGFFRPFVDQFPHDFMVLHGVVGLDAPDAFPIQPLCNVECRFAENR